MSPTPTYRILAIDDNPSIHEDYRKVLVGDACEHSVELDAAESILFGESQASHSDLFLPSVAVSKLSLPTQVNAGWKC